MLPVVKEDTLYSTIRSIDPDTNVFELINRENPVIISGIEATVTDDNYSEDFKDGFCKGVNWVYTLLKRQNEADEMNEGWI